MKSDTLIKDLRKFAVTLGENELPMAGILLDAAADEIEKTRALCRSLLERIQPPIPYGLIPPDCYWLRDD